MQCRELHLSNKFHFFIQICILGSGQADIPSLAVSNSKARKDDVQSFHGWFWEGLPATEKIWISHASFVTRQRLSRFTWKVSVVPVCMYMCSCADWMPVTQPPVDVMTKTSVAARPQESAAAAHDAGNTRVIAVSLTVCIAALVCLIIFVRAHSGCRLVFFVASLGGVIVRALDSWLSGHMFDHFQLFHFQVTTRGKLFTHTCFCHQAV